MNKVLQVLVQTDHELGAGGNAVGVEAWLRGQDLALLEGLGRQERQEDQRLQFTVKWSGSWLKPSRFETTWKCYEAVHIIIYHSPNQVTGFKTGLECINRAYGQARRHNKCCTNISTTREKQG